MPGAFARSTFASSVPSFQRARCDADMRLADELAKLPKAKGSAGLLKGKKAGTGRGRGKGKGSTKAVTSSGTKSEPLEEVTLSDLNVDKKWAASLVPVHKRQAFEII